MPRRAVRHCSIVATWARLQWNRNAVTVSEDLEPESQPVTYSLVQWMIDPQVEIDLETAAAEAEATAAPTAATAGDSSAAASGPAGGLP